MTQPYLIAHKVRGEAAFDVAIQMACPECLRTGKVLDGVACVECDGLGYWWIVPTSGHRAYPWNSIDLTLLGLINAGGMSINEAFGPMPSALPDHYRHGPAPKIDIRALFKKSDWVPNPEAFIKRRL